MEGSQEGHDDNRRFVSEYVQRLNNNNDIDGKLGLASTGPTLKLVLGGLLSHFVRTGFEWPVACFFC